MRFYCFVQFLCFRTSSLMWLYCGLDTLIGAGGDAAGITCFSKVESKSNSVMPILQDQPVLGMSPTKLSLPCSQ